MKSTSPLIIEAEELLTHHFSTLCKIIAHTSISQGDRRNRLLRLILAPNKNLPKSVILKQTDLDKRAHDHTQDVTDRFSHDWAGLAFLNMLTDENLPPIAPKFYGASAAHHFILLEDLGENHVSLVDFLTADGHEKGTTDAAIAALHRFMKSLSQMHLMARSHTTTYHELLQRVQGNSGAPYKNIIEKRLNDTLPKVKEALQALDLTFSNELQQDITNVLTAMFSPGSFITFTHGDICPDNVFDNPLHDTFRIFDFEWGEVRSALLDAAYPRMGMPTCWCAKAIPKSVILSLEKAYRESWLNQFEGSALYDKAYIEACAFWMIKGVLLMTDVLEKDEVWPSGDTPLTSHWDPAKNNVHPRIISRFQAFLDVCSLSPNISSNHLLHLQGLTKALFEKLHTRWPDATPLELYPAFQLQSP